MFNWFQTINSRWVPLTNSPNASDKKIYSEEQFKNMWFLRADSLGSCGRKAFSYKNVCCLRAYAVSKSSGYVCVTVQTNPDNNKMKMLNT